MRKTNWFNRFWQITLYFSFELMHRPLNSNEKCWKSKKIEFQIKIASRWTGSETDQSEKKITEKYHKGKKIKAKSRTFCFIAHSRNESKMERKTLGKTNHINHLRHLWFDFTVHNSHIYQTNDIIINPWNYIFSLIFFFCFSLLLPYFVQFLCLFFLLNFFLFWFGSFSFIHLFLYILSMFFFFVSPHNV